MSQQITIGIDFGTCSTNAAVLMGDQVESVNLSQNQFSPTPSMPTAICVEDSGQILVGAKAVGRRLANGTRYIDKFKLEMEHAPGREIVVGGTPKMISWTEIVKAVLLQVKLVAEQDLNNGAPITDVVLTVPALYARGGVSWKIMEESARLAGFHNIEIIREPHAAALHYDHLMDRAGKKPSQDGEYVLIYDLGGGTFDPALIRRKNGEYPVERAGEGAACGGIFFDQKLLEDFQRKCPASTPVPPIRNADGKLPDDQKTVAARYIQDSIAIESFLQRCKHSFSEKGTTEFSEEAPPIMAENYSITRHEFQDLVRPLIEQTIVGCKSLLTKSGISWDDLTAVVLVGGSSSLPEVQDRIATSMRDSGADPSKIIWQRIPATNILLDPAMAVCRGAAWHGRMLARKAKGGHEEREMKRKTNYDEEDKPTLEQARDATYWEPRLRKKMEAAAKETFTILMIGRAGMGKSSTVNSLLGADIAPVGRFEVTTRAVECYPTELFGAKAMVIDTPGLCDDVKEKGNDEEYIAQIKETVAEVDCLFFVTRLDETRVRSDEKDAIRLITKAFGKKLWENAIIIFTFADNVRPWEFIECVAERSRFIRQEISASATQKIAKDIPAIPVSNRDDLTPDGQEWLPELFVTTVERMSSHGLLPFMMATAPRIKIREDKSSPLADRPLDRQPQETRSYRADVFEPAPRDIVLDSSHISRLERQMGDFGEKLGGLLGREAAAVGRSLGESVGRGIESFGNKLKSWFG